MKLALHPGIRGPNLEMMADFCRYLRVEDLFYDLHCIESYQDGGLANPSALDQLQERFGSFGLRLSVLYDSLPDTVEALEKRREGLLGTLELLARARVNTLVLFMLQEDSSALMRPLEELYKAVVPRAEALGIKIATHAHWCEGHIAYNRKTVQRIIEFAPQPSNGICLCTGCYFQAGDDVIAMIREMPDRIHCMHIRDTTLRGGCDFEELAFGAGLAPIPGIMRALAEVGYDGIVIPEHMAPIKDELYAEASVAHAVGYLQGIMSAPGR